MENNQKLQHTVRFGENDVNQATDSGDELESDDFDQQHSRTSSVIRSAGDMNSISSISTSILDDGEEVKSLKDKLLQIEARCKALEIEANDIRLHLTHEKTKNAKLEKKLQFVKDNQEVFMRLKEAYINMKYNEAAGRKMIEIREKGNQTWDGILCRNCLETEQIRRQIEEWKETYKEAYLMVPCEMQQLTNTVKYLKDLIDRREKSWSFNMERENRMQTHIQTIEEENITLRKLLQSRPMVNERNDETTIISECNSPEVTQLKKIVIKYEKRFREIEKINVDGGRIAPSLNEKEKRIVQHLMTKYYLRCGAKMKSRSLSRERKPDKSSKPSKKLTKEEPTPSTEQHVDLAMVMMDCFYDKNVDS